MPFRLLSCLYQLQYPSDSSPAATTENNQGTGTKKAVAFFFSHTRVFFPPLLYERTTFLDVSLNQSVDSPNLSSMPATSWRA